MKLKIFRFKFLIDAHADSPVGRACLLIVVAVFNVGTFLGIGLTARHVVGMAQPHCEGAAFGGLFLAICASIYLLRWFLRCSPLESHVKPPEKALPEPSEKPLPKQDKALVKSAEGALKPPEKPFPKQGKGSASKRKKDAVNAKGRSKSGSKK